MRNPTQPLRTSLRGSPYHPKEAYEYDDQGTVTGTVDQDGGLILTFESDSYGDSFVGRYTEDGTTTMRYDVDGDGEPDTSLGFTRVQ